MSAVSSDRAIPFPHTRKQESIRAPRRWTTIQWRRWLPLILPGSVLFGIVLATILAPVIAPYDPNALDMQSALSGPTWEHWLGTDQLGRDQLSRMLYGGRTTLLIAGIGVASVVLIGLVIGTVSGFAGGRLDALTSTAINMLLALPTLLLTLAILGILGPGRESLMIATVAAGWVSHARIFRSTVISLKQRLYVDAAHALGASNLHILLKHVWPNLITTIVVLATLDIGVFILTISSLSFLGLGVQPPNPDWGVMLNDARSFVAQVPILALAPGICITLISLTSNLLGDAIRDALDVRN